MYEINTNIILVFYKMLFYLYNIFTLIKIATRRKITEANYLRGLYLHLSSSSKIQVNTTYNITRSRHKTETFSRASFSYADKSNIKKNNKSCYGKQNNLPVSCLRCSNDTHRTGIRRLGSNRARKRRRRARSSAIVRRFRLLIKHRFRL